MVTQPYSSTTTRTTTPIIGGILSIISASITLVFVIFWFISASHPFDAIFAFGGLMVVQFVTSILAILGGILAIKRRTWLLSLFGVIASIVSFVGLLGIIATVLIAVSKKEFDIQSSASGAV